MGVTESEVERLRAMSAKPAVAETDDWSAIQSVAEVFAFTIAKCRHERWDEVDGCELLVKAMEMPAAEIRRVEHTLRPLGYDLVCARLRELARHAKRPKLLGPPGYQLVRNDRGEVIEVEATNSRYNPTFKK